MTVSGIVRSEPKIEFIEEQLKEHGLYERYEGRIRGEYIVVAVRIVAFAEVELVRRILEDAGVVEIFYEDENAA